MISLLATDRADARVVRAARPDIAAQRFGARMFGLSRSSNREVRRSASGCADEVEGIGCRQAQGYWRLCYKNSCVFQLNERGNSSWLRSDTHSSCALLGVNLNAIEDSWSDLSLCGRGKQVCPTRVAKSATRAAVKQDEFWKGKTCGIETVTIFGRPRTGYVQPQTWSHCTIISSARRTSDEVLRSRQPLLRT
jgi:hypothetical protein